MRKLKHALIAKSIAETVFVGSLAVAFYFVSFNPYFRGALDVATERSVEGWAVDEASPPSRVEVHLYIDGVFIAVGEANLSRPDVHAAGKAPDDLHGFRFQTPPLAAGEHEARVYAAQTSRDRKRRTLQMIGAPIRFVVSPRRVSVSNLEELDHR